MREAFVFGVIASSALVIGSAVGIRVRLPERFLALLLAFASGALISALAFELFEDAHEKSGAWIASLAFVAGAAVFIAISSWLDRRGGNVRPDREAKFEKEVAADDARERGGASASAGAGWALLAAVTLDGVPENTALGVSLTGEGGSLALLLAIFASNFPEALVGSAAMEKGGRTGRSILITWIAAAILLAAAVVAGEALIPQTEPHAISVPLAFAGGAVIASLADTLMPEAFEGGGPTVAFGTVAGFLLSYLLTTV
jgi:zinc transporter, ZIP family